MNAEIITVGTELLRGDIANSNSQFLSHELAAFGIHVTHLTTVDDEYEPLCESLSHALERTDLIIMCSNLDGKSGNRVREAVSHVVNRPLCLNEESWERIQEYFVSTCREMPSDSRENAMLPQGCTVFPNDHGTATGCAVPYGQKQVVLVPGTPRELYPMYSDYVSPYLSNLAGGTTVSRTVGVFGLPETVLNERLADLMSEANPGVAAYSKDGEAILRVTAHATDRKSALTLCEPVVQEIKNRLSVNVYGVDIGSLQKAVVAMLMDNGMKIATAESCTAGLLSGRLTEVAGASSVFECGVAAYSKEIKHNILGVPMELIDKYGTVSPEVARAMAVGVRRVGNAALGVSITGVAGPDISEGKPVGTVYIALADTKRVWVKKIETKEGTVEREYVRAVATSYALDLARRYLEAMPTVMAGGEIIEPEPIPTQVIPEGKTTKPKHLLLSHILPWKGDEKADVMRKSAILLAFLLLLAALVSIVYMKVLRPVDNISLYNDLKSMFTSSTSAVPVHNMVNYPEGMQTQFYELYSHNEDIRGWVNINDTNINYPVMDYRTNEYYADHNFYGQNTAYGTPCFITDTSLRASNAEGRTMVIRGNNTCDGQMFSELTNYYNHLDYLITHPVIEMDTLYYSGKWKIISVMAVENVDVQESVTEDNKFNYLQSSFSGESDFLDFVKQIRKRSFYILPEGQDDVKQGDSLLMLVTDCSEIAGADTINLIITARQLRNGESQQVDISGTVYNPHPLLPSQWKKSNHAAPNKAYPRAVSSDTGNPSLSTSADMTTSQSETAFKCTTKTAEDGIECSSTSESDKTQSTTTTIAEDNGKGEDVPIEEPPEAGKHPVDAICESPEIEENPE